MNSEVVHLAAGGWELEAQPARGGAITALRHAGRAVLVSPDPSTADAMGAASFAMLPYCNRIARGELEHGGQRWRLPRNFGEHPHPLHGTGWKRPWAVTAQHPQALELCLVHAADQHWPWAFSARQRISLKDDEVLFELEVDNTADVAAPMGVGFHPAFAACAATTLHTQLEGVWLIDKHSLPVSLEPAEAVLDTGNGAAVLRQSLVDHCFTGWARELLIHDAGYDGALPAVVMRASASMDFLQLYMPPGRNWFCAEPMSHMPDAIHRQAVGSGLRILAPRESLHVWMSIAVQAGKVQRLLPIYY